jgi:hypothetical protein
MYPVSFTAGEAGERRRDLGVAGIFFPIKLLWGLPHLLITSALGSLSNVLAYIGYFFVAFTGELPPFFRDTLVAIQRWQLRTTSWIAAITDEYPPYTWDDVEYPVRWDVTDPATRSKGLAVAGIFLPVKLLLALPHLITVAVLAVAAVFAAWFNYFIIVFTGKSSPGIHNFLVGITRWGSRLEAWLWGLTDEYPPFSLDA